MKKVKAFFNKLPIGDSVFEIETYFPFYVFFKNYDVEVVNCPEEADVIFEFVRHGGKSCLNLKNKKVVMVSGENIYMKRIFFNWLERAMRFPFGNKKKYKVMDKLDSIIPAKIQKIPISYFFPEYVKFVKQVKKGRKNAYVIWCNGESRNKRIYNYPLILSNFHERLHKLVKKGDGIDPKKRKKFCAFAVSSNSARERVHFFRKLSRYKKVDSFGKVMHNTEVPKDDHWMNNDQLFSDYKFGICFENCFADDFVTEKIMNVMLSGAIPIYRGPKNSKKYFNSKSYIDYDDYGSDEKMIEKIIELDNDDEKYIEYSKRPWYHENKMPNLLKQKEEELTRFYEEVFDDIAG